MGLADGEAWERENPVSEEEMALRRLEEAYGKAAGVAAQCRVTLARANAAYESAKEAMSNAVKAENAALTSLLKHQGSDKILRDSRCDLGRR